jgi:hypothetical protein
VILCEWINWEINSSPLSCLLLVSATIATDTTNLVAITYLTASSVIVAASAAKAHFTAEDAYAASVYGTPTNAAVSGHAALCPNQFRHFHNCCLPHPPPQRREVFFSKSGICAVSARNRTTKNCIFNAGFVILTNYYQ